MANVISSTGQPLIIDADSSTAGEINSQLPARFNKGMMFRQNQDGSVTQLRNKDRVNDDDVVVITPSHQAGSTSH
ncbi:MAG TPA: hypothetical protein PKV10_05490 [Thermoanaerobaculia bacterium]|nr:hypothetical protein [Thermoanaerobaculia bacterium]